MKLAALLIIDTVRAHVGNDHPEFLSDCFRNRLLRTLSGTLDAGAISVDGLTFFLDLEAFAGWSPASSFLGFCGTIARRNNHHSTKQSLDETIRRL
jgi:hypothetical protein